MARPKTKKALIELNKTNYDRLLNFISEIPGGKLDTQFHSRFLNRNIRDVLAHLHHWHLLLLSWYDQGMQGKKPDMPALGYTWKTIPELNIEINEKYKKEPLSKIKKLLNQSFTAVQKMIRKHSNDELFEKQRYKWTGTTSLGAYIISASSSHYDWALKLIKKGLKST